ncbi:MAG: RNA-binding protein [Rhodospirillales bacterium]
MAQQPRRNDGGEAPSQATSPLRTCIASGAVKPKDAMVRFVVGPDGGLVADLDGRLPGRGLWLSAARDMVNTACAKGLFSRAARNGVTVPEDLADRLDRQMARRCLDLIGLARRAGEAVAGFEKAQAWLRGGKGGVVLAASDGAADGRRKIRALAPGLPFVDLFSATELGRALGLDSAVHVVIAEGRLADRLIREAGRLASFGTGGREHS